MIPASHITIPTVFSIINDHIHSIVSGHYDRLTDLEGLIGNRLDDQFDTDEVEKGNKMKDERSSEEGV